MPFQLTELAIPVADNSSQDAWAELGSTCRKGGSTCVAREPAMPQTSRYSEFALVQQMVRRQIRETATTTPAA
jgi:hypothetical protein